MVQILLNKTAAQSVRPILTRSMPPSVSGTSVSRSVSGLRPCWRRRAPCRRFGALIASTIGKDKKRALAPPAKKNDGDASGYGLPPEPSLASSAAMRAFKASFSSRASRAISLTASNSSRLTTSRSRKMRSAWLRNMVSNSRRTPEATPAASFISRAISSKKRLLVWVIAGLGFAFKAPAGTMVTVCSARKAGRDASVISDHCGSILQRSKLRPPSRAGRRAIGRTHNQKIRKTGHPCARPLDFAPLLPASPRHIARESPDAALRPPLPRFPPRAHQLGAGRHPLVCSRLHRRHRVGLALCARNYPPRAVLGLTGAYDRHRLRRLRAVGDARHHPRGPDRLRAVLQSELFRRASA